MGKEDVKLSCKDFRVVADFPKEGINFIDITTVLNDYQLFRQCILELEQKVENQFDYDSVDVIVSMDARGFIFGAALAAQMGVRFVPVRKEGKLPYKTIKGEYSLEYGTDTLEIHTDSIKEGDKVLVVDDILATGGTALCVCEMIKKLGGIVQGCLFVAELSDLGGLDLLSKNNITSDCLCKFSDKYLEKNKQIVK